MEYPWPEVRYRFTGGKPPPQRKAKSNLLLPEPTSAEYREFLLTAVHYLGASVDVQNKAIELLSRGVPRNGEQG